MPATLTAPALLVALLASAPGPAAVQFVLSTGPLTGPVELATDAATQARGLMHRTDLPTDAGMLFVFADDAVRRFWMKNTPLPLDMIFLDADLRVVGVVAATTPHSRAVRAVAAPSRYVLEVHAGLAARHRIVTGSRARLLPAGAAAPAD